MCAFLRYWGARVAAFLGGRRMDRDFDQELGSHVDMLTDEYVARGMAAPEARRRAILRVGPAAALKERHRDVRGLPVVETVLQDLRFAFRMIAKERWVSFTVVMTLALGIGANSMGFTVLNAAFFRPLPFDEPDRVLTLTWRSKAGRRVDVSPRDLEEWRAASRSFDELAGFTDDAININGEEGVAERVRGTWVTANAFGVLRLPPVLGRDFREGEDAPGAEPVAIIGHDLWQTRFGGDPNVLGRSLRLNGQPATIVGVAAAGMRFPDNNQLWAPLSVAGSADDPDARNLTVFGRLTDGVGQPQSQAEFAAIAQQFAAAHPEVNRDIVGINVETFTQAFIGGLGRTMFITIMVAVTFVLLISCANVANLLLSRATSRAREVALRMAVGATRRRIIRQLLTESVVLALIGGGLGLLFAIAAVRAFASAQANVGLPYWVVYEVDLAVIVYVSLVCLATAVVFGLAPALQISRTNAHAVLKESARTVLGNARARWFSGGLVVVETVLTIVLLAGAGLMARSFLKLYSVDLGVDTRPLTAMRVQLSGNAYASPESRLAFFDTVEERIAAIAGITGVAVTTGVPGSDGGERLLETDGARSGAPPTFVSTVTISPSFFAVVDRPIVRGRGFSASDGAPGAENVIINERLAAQYFPGEDPIGRHLRFTQRNPAPGEAPDVWRTIVGISPTILHGAPQDGYLNAVVYLPYRQQTERAASLLIRSALPPAVIMDAVRRDVREIDRDQPVFTIQTVDQLLSGDRWPYRVFGSLFAVLATIALVVSFVGVYAVMSYSVSQRTQEIGVRMAVGAQSHQVSWLIVRRGLLQLALALPIGLAGALALGVVLQGMLVDMGPGDPVTFAAITLVLIVASLAACLIPAYRASHVDPMIALRTD